LWTGFVWLGIDTSGEGAVVNTVTNLWFSSKFVEFVDYVRNCQLVKEGSAV
jgi:hypothetical protein